MQDGAGAAAPISPGSLEGLVAVVTGGNRGIGLGIARALGQAGAAVSIWARDAERGADAARELAGEGIRTVFVGCDVTREQDVVAAAQRTVDELGRIDACVANAGGTGRRRFVETELDEWDGGLALNLTSTFLTFRESARHMRASGGGGALVAVSSCAAVHGAPLMHAYAAAKAGLGGLVRSIAVELAPEGIRCNVLMPGWTTNSTLSTTTVPEWQATDTIASIPFGRWGTPEDIGRAAVFLSDPRFGYHTGTELRVDGGYSVMPPHVAARASREIDAGRRDRPALAHGDRG